MLQANGIGRAAFAIDRAGTLHVAHGESFDVPRFRTVKGSLGVAKRTIYGAMLANESGIVGSPEPEYGRTSSCHSLNMSDV